MRWKLLALRNGKIIGTLKPQFEQDCTRFLSTLISVQQNVLVRPETESYDPREPSDSFGREKRKKEAGERRKV